MRATGKGNEVDRKAAFKMARLPQKRHQEGKKRGQRLEDGDPLQETVEKGRPQCSRTCVATLTPKSGKQEDERERQNTCDTFPQNSSPHPLRTTFYQDCPFLTMAPTSAYLCYVD